MGCVKMLKIYITDNSILEPISKFTSGCWINMINPTQEESDKVCQYYNIDPADLRAALDNEETSRVYIEDTYILILFDIPSIEIRHKQVAYTTIPLGIIVTQSSFICICSEETPILKPFIQGIIKDFNTKKQMKSIYQILIRACMFYQNYLRVIDKKRIEIEENIGNNTKDVDLVNLHELESNLVYFDTSLRTNKMVIERLSRHTQIKKYPEDQDLLDDLVIENQQAIEMSQIYHDIIRGTRDLVSSIMDNRLNNVMKYLAAITIVMAIPTVISGLYGMNLNQEGMPLSDNIYGFGIICLIIFGICLITIFILKKRKML